MHQAFPSNEDLESINFTLSITPSTNTPSTPPVTDSNSIVEDPSLPSVATIESVTASMVNLNVEQVEQGMSPLPAPSSSLISSPTSDSIILSFLSNSETPTDADPTSTPSPTGFSAALNLVAEAQTQIPNPISNINPIQISIHQAQLVHPDHGGNQSSSNASAGTFGSGPADNTPIQAPFPQNHPQAPYDPTEADLRFRLALVQARIGILEADNARLRNERNHLRVHVDALVYDLSVARYFYAYYFRYFRATAGMIDALRALPPYPDSLAGTLPALPAPGGDPQVFYTNAAAYDADDDMDYDSDFSDSDESVVFIGTSNAATAVVESAPAPAYAEFPEEEFNTGSD